MGADTQWIRVSAIRPTTVTSTAPIDAAVTIEHLQTGEVFALSDSLFAYPSQNPQVPGNLLARSFWTTETVLAGNEYRVSATRSDGAVSEALVAIPPAIDEEVLVEINLRSNVQAAVVFRGVEHLAMVSVLHHLPSDCPLSSPYVTYQSMAGSTSMPDGRVRVYVTRQPTTGTFPCRELEKEIQIASAGAPWPFDPGMDAATALLPDATSNVANGAGFVGGLVMKTVPFEHCRTSAPAAIGDLCILRYDSDSATLKGIVHEGLCTGPPGVASIELSERGRDRIRGTTSSDDGGFTVGALETEIEYDMTIRSSHGEYRQLVAFEAGETRFVEVALTGAGQGEVCSAD